MATIYPDRFDLKYLEFLAEQLELEALMSNAIEESKRDGHGETIKCIPISYCGFASNTLLGNDTFGKGATLNPEVSRAKKQVERNFKHLFVPSILDRLAREGYYVKIRFCFAYVYSDFPVCLIKAEDRDNWNYIRDGTKYDYHYTKPIDFDELKEGSIYKSQEASLQIIKQTLQRAYDAGHDLATWEKQKHSIHIRFTVLPSPLCMLIINKMAMTDAYLYGMLQDDQRQKEYSREASDEVPYQSTCSLNYPVSITREREDKNQFESIQNHFKYLWRHDLTLLCGDGTGFKIIGKENGIPTYDFKGLTSITPPHKVRWGDKIQRIKNSKERNRLPQRNWFYIHFSWKPKLTNKLRLCTSKVVSPSFLGRFIYNVKSNMLQWLVSTLMIFAFFFIYFLFAKDPDISEILKWFTSHAAFEILKASAYFLGLLIVQSLLASRK